MNLEKRFIEIKQFLTKHKTLLDTEVLELYPFNNLPYSNWIDELKVMNKSELIELESNLNSAHIKSDQYKDFLKAITGLTQIETAQPSLETIPNQLKRKLSLKKQHEINQIRDILKESSAENYIDIGSGAGHLSSLLLLNNKKTSLCIDCESKFQQIGITKLKKDAPDIFERIKFKTLEVTPNFNIPKIKKSLLIGLHACGDLSVNIIKSFSESETPELLSLGCCYHKLTHDKINISQISKVGSLELTNHALTMAAKSFKDLNIEEFDTRNKVKTYRYTIHLFMQDVLGIGFKTLGNATSADYNGHFSKYVKKYVTEAQGYSDQELESYFLQKKSDVEDIISLGIIRSHLSRLVELYLILDRAIYLEEKGFTIKVTEIFNKALSPRNICILAKKSNQ
jgi:hypothetical protein